MQKNTQVTCKILNKLYNPNTMFATVFKSIYLKYVNLLPKDRKTHEPISYIMRYYGNNNNKNSKCKRTISRLNIKVNFGKDI